MKTVFNGTEIRCTVEEANFSRYIKPDITPYLVLYDHDKNTVTVDERADDEYIKYAAIHECICCGRYGHLYPQTEDRSLRCFGIDVMIIESMNESDGRDYAKKRIEMFEAILNENLEPSLRSVNEQTLARLKKFYGRPVVW